MTTIDPALGPTPENFDELLAYVLRLKADYDSHNHDGISSQEFQTINAETVSARTFTIRKDSYGSVVSGLWLGLVGDRMQLNLGDSTSYIKFDENGNIKISGDLEGGSLNINGNAVIDSNGYATFKGVSILNSKIYSAFESNTRFSPSSAGSGSVNFGSSGAQLATSTTSNSHAQIVMIVVGYNVFAGQPTFSCTMRINKIDTSNGTHFYGLGNVGAPADFPGSDHIGFKIVGNALYGTCGNGSTATASLLSSVSVSDAVDMILRINGQWGSLTSVDFYYRINSGSFSSATTISTNLPDTTSAYLCFHVDNGATTSDIESYVQSMSYER